jgi:hypothetical protein
MASWLDAIPLAGKLIDGITTVISRFFPDKDKATQCATEIALQVIDTVKAEIGSDNKIVALWRAVVMMLFGGVIGYRSVMQLGPDWIIIALFLIGLTGYQITDNLIGFIGKMTEWVKPKQPPPTLKLWGAREGKC